MGTEFVVRNVLSLCMGRTLLVAAFHALLGALFFLFLLLFLRDLRMVTALILARAGLLFLVLTFLVSDLVFRLGLVFVFAFFFLLVSRFCLIRLRFLALLRKDR